jgi:diguanylate cyclase (GGDEF)-like protein
VETTPTLVAGRRPPRGIARLARRLLAPAGAMGFGARLLVSTLVTFAAVGLMGSVLMGRQLRSSQLDNYASSVRADARSIEAIGRTHTGADVPPDVQRLMRSIGQRPGTLEALLIDQGSVVRASGTPVAGGARDSDPRIVAALRDGTSYAGHEADPSRDAGNFEFVTPVELPSGRHALEVSYDHRFLDDNLSRVRRTMVLIGLLGLVGGGLVFYLAGGRSLLRSHRLALTRATRDGLTDLPNHRAFQDEFPQAVGWASRHNEPFALAVFDLDDFKLLNDRHGHPHGDAVLGRVADVLRAGRVQDRAYRIGGDEFAMVLPHADEEGARTFARRLSRSLTDAEAVVSIGVSNLHAGQSAEELRAEADAALYEAKRRGRQRIAHFDEIRGQVVITTSARTGVVRRLIDEGRLSTEFQPIWDLAAPRLLGVEALMRPDPAYGLSGPAEAFDLAEQIGRGHELDVLATHEALRTIAGELPADTLLFLNLCPLTIDLDADGNDWLLEAVEGAGLTPDRVVIEVTERVTGRAQSIVKCLDRLRGQGFKLALDDVGTGNSGLQMLQSIAADFVKIDRSIVAGAPTDPNARAVLMAMATYARQTGSYVIAEGIEDQECLEYLRDIDDRDARPDRIIQGGQGFRLGRPAAHVSAPPPAVLTG